MRPFGGCSTEVDIFGFSVADSLPVAKATDPWAADNWDRLL
jgi:hypothetical protein